jgi:hypothetical protein
MIPMGHKSETAVPTMPCAARTQVTPQQLLGVPGSSELQSAGASPEEATARARVFPGGVTCISLLDPLPGGGRQVR